jgi:hypothetical protein
MGQNNQQVTPQQPAAGAGIRGLLNDPLVKEFGLPLAKKWLNDELGISNKTQAVEKTKFGKIVYGLRDVWKLAWWSIPLFYLLMMFAVLLIKVANRYAGF